MTFHSNDYHDYVFIELRK